MEKHHLLLLARYHRWAYQQLFETLKPLSNSAYYENQGLFFNSVHGTLNHLLLVDRLWLSRFKDMPFAVNALDEILEEDRSIIKTALLDGTNCWIQFISEIDPNLLKTKLSYTNTKGVTVNMPYVDTMIHVFNHGTHHRGQISTVITQLGYSSPVMDLLYFDINA